MQDDDRNIRIFNHLEFLELVLDEYANEVLVLDDVQPVVFLRVALVLSRCQVKLQPNSTFNI